MDEYEKMLEAGRNNLPKSVFERERFEIPKVLGHVQGNRTVVSNFVQIADTLRRPVDHLLKFILKELATPGDLKGNQSLIFGSKVPAGRINEKIKKYAEEFVLCKECGKPDTHIEKEGEFSFVRCQVCGAKHAVRSRI
jgi:translation initiation factor 2 subunit 2